jgi:PAS domain-containing protein
MPSRRPPDEFVTFAAGDPIKPLTPRSKKRNPIANPRLSGWADVLQSSDDAIISKNLDGIITSWNLGAERLFGYSAEEAVGKAINILITSRGSE